jgi:hypothetical protein
MGPIFVQTLSDFYSSDFIPATHQRQRAMRKSRFEALLPKARLSTVSHAKSMCGLDTIASYITN